MSDDQPSINPSPAPDAEPVALRREALLPNERNRGLGTVAVVCTMAGVASGLALATTLMAMQVADTMASRSACSYRVVTPVERPDHGFLGIRYVFRDGIAQVESVIPGTPAAMIGLKRGDHVVSVNGDRVDSASELQERIFSASPGSRPLLLINREGAVETVRPTLVSWPAPTY